MLIQDRIKRGITGPMDPDEVVVEKVKKPCKCKYTWLVIEWQVLVGESWSTVAFKFGDGMEALAETSKPSEAERTNTSASSAGLPEGWEYKTKWRSGPFVYWKLFAGKARVMCPCLMCFDIF